MDYKIRPLKTDDIFAVADILSKLDISFGDVKVEGNTIEEKQEAAGKNIIMQVIKNINKAKKEINTFLGDLVGLTEDEFSKLPIKDLMKILGDLIKSEDFKDFLSIVGK